MSVHDRLASIQSELKAPKGQYNSFGKYSYRSAEDILEAVKPLLAKNGCTLTLSDEVVQIGDRFYVKTTAELASCDVNDFGSATVTAYAREEDTKKGMDGAQITGAASSYARKYALNGLFAIDDTKDPDATNTHGQNKPQKPKTRTNTSKKAKTPDLDPSQTATDAQVREFVEAASKFASMKHKNFDEVMRAVNTTKTMRNLGTDENTADYNQVQCAAATELVRSWIRKSIESGS